MSQRQLVTVVIDSNAIWNDWNLDRKAWDAFEVFVEHGLLRVYLPEVVVQEVARGYKREVNDLLSGLNKLGLWKLETLLELNTPSTIKKFKASVEPRINAYEATLRDRLDERQVMIAPVPQIDQQTILTRALENRKPFDGEGKNGYRDALVWHTVLDLCEAANGATKVLFVTDNTGDFCVRKTGELLPELRAEAAAIGAAPVVTVRDLAAAMDYLRETEQLDAAVAPEVLPVVAPPRELIIESVAGACYDLAGQQTQTAERPEDNWTVGLDFTNFSTVIEDDATLQDVEPDLSTLGWATDGRDSSGRPVVEVSVTAQLRLEGMAFKADYFAEDGTAIEVYDGDWNNHYMWVGTYHTGRLSFTLYLTQDGSEVDEVVFLNAEEVLSGVTGNPE